MTIDDDGKTRGLNDRLRGQMGVSTSALREGCTMGPPADNEYAVDPVGVETIRPSDWHTFNGPYDQKLVLHTTASVRCWPSTKMSIVFKCGLDPR